MLTKSSDPAKLHPVWTKSTHSNTNEQHRETTTNTQFERCGQENLEKETNIAEIF